MTTFNPNEGMGRVELEQWSRTPSDFYIAKDGETRLSPMEFERKMADPSYRVVGQRELWNGIFVSTVWLGVDHGFNRLTGRRILFETLVFKSRESMRELDGMRYASEEAAKAGHAAFVRNARLSFPRSPQWWFAFVFGLVNGFAMGFYCL